MSNKKSAFGPVADLLSKFQVRLDSLTSQLADNRRKFVFAVEACNLAVKQINGVAEKTMDAHRMATDALLDIEKQKGTNKELTESLYKLRESVQKSFDAVRDDISQLLVSQQRLNERLSKLESIASEGHDYAKINDLTQRVAVIENVIRSIRALVGLVSKV